MPYAVGTTKTYGPTNSTVGGPTVRGKPRGPTFEQVLVRTEQGKAAGSQRPLQFSSHALDRMRAHGIRMDAALRQKLQAGLELARSKGINESLVVTDHVSFILSVPNSAVITMVPRGAPQGDVFTKIDGAVIV